MSKTSNRELNVSSIWDTETGFHIAFGGQIADKIKQGVDAVVIKGEVAEMQPCFGVQKAEMASKGECEGNMEIKSPMSRPGMRW